VMGRQRHVLRGVLKLPGPKERTINVRVLRPYFKEKSRTRGDRLYVWAEFQITATVEEDDYYVLLRAKDLEELLYFASVRLNRLALRMGLEIPVGDELLKSVIGQLRELLREARTVLGKPEPRPRPVVVRLGHEAEPEAEEW